MFFTLILENANGDRVDMTTTANQYMTAKVEGLNPPPGTISTSGYAGMDGSIPIVEAAVIGFLRLCRHGRQLSEQRLHREAECGHSFRDAGRGTGSPQASTLQGRQALTLHQGLLCNGRH